MNQEIIPCVAGSTGLVGSFLLKNLTKSYSKVVSITRRKFNHNSSNIKNVVIDFDNIENENIFNNNNHLYIALGTTRKKAGSDKNFIKVDYDYCINLAKKAVESGVKRVSIVSSVGSNPKSTLLYPKTKGLMEQELSKLPFEHISIMKPGLILGDRLENRLVEKIAKILFSLINPFLFGGLKKYKSIHADVISKAMINQIITGDSGFFSFEYAELVESLKN